MRYLHLLRYLLKAWAKWYAAYPEKTEEDKDADTLQFNPTTGQYEKPKE